MTLNSVFLWRRVPYFAAIVIATISPLVANQQNSGRVALVVSNSSYVHVDKLANTKNDGIDVANAFRILGFDTIEGQDLDKIKLEDAIQDFGSKVKIAEDAIFYFAGHAIQVSGRNYLVPVDAQLSTVSELESNLTDLETIQRVMRTASRANIIFLDACRNNPFAQNLSRGLGGGRVEIARGLAPVASGANTLIAFSTQPYNVALDGSGRNSPYAAALLKNIGKQHSDISALLMQVRKEVMKNTNNQQVPWEHSSLLQPFFFTSEPAQTISDNLKGNDKDGAIISGGSGGYDAKGGSYITHGGKSPIISNAGRDVTITYGE